MKTLLHQQYELVAMSYWGRPMSRILEINLQWSNILPS